jgi:hypothetical protein
VAGAPAGAQTRRLDWDQRLRRAGNLDEMRARCGQGGIVTLICDPGDRYLDSCYDRDRVRAPGLDPGPFTAWLESFPEVS